MSAVRLLANLAAPLHAGSITPLLYAGPVHTRFNPWAVEALFHTPLHAGPHAWLHALFHALSLAAPTHFTAAARSAAHLASAAPYSSAAPSSSTATFGAATAASFPSTSAPAAAAALTRVVLRDLEWFGGRDHRGAQNGCRAYESQSQRDRP